LQLLVAVAKTTAYVRELGFALAACVRMVALRQFEDEAVAQAAEKRRTDVRVFLGGPFIDIHKSRLSSYISDGAALLRHRLFFYLENNMGCTVSIGEMTELEDVYRENYGPSFDSATMEISHISNNCDAVIIIPNSPGSFCELGYFAASDDVCQKMLVLMNQKYASPPGYIHLGPVVQAQENNSIVHSVDYFNFEIIVGIVKLFVERIKIRKMKSKYRLKQ
jgi:hypothetical protein